MKGEQQMAMPWSDYRISEAARLLETDWWRVRTALYRSGLAPRGSRLRAVRIAAGDLDLVRTTLLAPPAPRRPSKPAEA